MLQVCIAEGPVALYSRQGLEASRKIRRTIMTREKLVTAFRPQNRISIE